MDRLSNVKSASEPARDILGKPEVSHKVGDLGEEPPVPDGAPDVVKASPPKETEYLVKATPPPSQADSGNTVRFRAMNMLTEACNNGCLEKALEGLYERRKEEVVEVSEKCRQQGSSELATAATVGCVEKTLMKPEETLTTAPVVLEPLSTAERARKVLEEAGESGHLERVLKCVCPAISASVAASNPPVSRDETVYLSEMARNCLIQGVANGTLEQILKKACPVKKIGLEEPVFEPREKAAEKAVEVTAESSIEATKAFVEDTACLKAKIFDSLMSACKTGHLSDLLKDVSCCSTMPKEIGTQKPSETLMAAEACAPTPLQQTAKLDATARSKRHAELLGRQRMLKEMNEQYEGQLSCLKERKMTKPSAPPAPPAGPRPNRPGRSIKNSSAFRELCEVNSSLCNENARLNAELARLLLRAGQQRSNTAT